jgi:hypothetical protein
MTGCGKHGKTIELFSHTFHQPLEIAAAIPTLHTATTTRKISLKTYEAKTRTMMHNTTTQVGQIR